MSYHDDVKLLRGDHVVDDNLRFLKSIAVQAELVSSR